MDNAGIILLRELKEAENEGRLAQHKYPLNGMGVQFYIAGKPILGIGKERNSFEPIADMVLQEYDIIPVRQLNKEGKLRIAVEGDGYRIVGLGHVTMTPDRILMENRWGNSKIDEQHLKDILPFTEQKRYVIDNCAFADDWLD